MLISSHILLGAALISAQMTVPPSIHLAGRPTTFDYYRAPAPATGWLNAIVHRVDARGGLLTVRGASPASRTVLTFPVDDRAICATHRAGELIKIQVFQEGGAIRVRHLDQN